MQRFIDSPSALATGVRERDSREQLEVLTRGQDSLAHLPLAKACQFASDSPWPPYKTAAAWVQYIAARNLLVIDGRRFTLDSTLGEIASALAVSVPENPNGTK